ncbi:hypothetical protein ACHHYP_14513 [Achlya hypogyna]|uniref:Ankyrin repeat protein n=1 Tax=Achlya hypogyna TaxID=1202772 RepID=A0A1V9YD31_ACHHY|nr:hypothetical protein ACHHYP_14513 [Achlya hypogyna]
MGRVLRLADLLRSIAAFQDGCTLDTIAVLRLLRAAYASKDTCYYNDPPAVLPAMTAWRVNRGDAGLDLLCERGCARALFLFGLAHGDVSILSRAARHVVVDELLYLVAAKHGHVASMAFLLDLAASPDMPLVSEAARWGHLPLVRYLHEKGLNTDHVLYCACTYGHVAVAEYAHANGLGQWYPSLLTTLATKGDLAMVQFLHRHGYAGVTPQMLVVAAKWGHADLVVYLYEEGLVACFDEALFKAAWQGHLNIVKWLDQQRPERDVPSCILENPHIGPDVMKYFLLERRAALDHSTRFLRCQQYQAAGVSATRVTK